MGQPVSQWRTRPCARLRPIMRSKTFLVLGLAGMIGAAGMLAAPTQGAQTQDAPEAVEKMGRNMSPPRVTYSPPAEFSEEARAAKYQGRSEEHTSELQSLR